MIGSLRSSTARRTALLVAIAVLFILASLGVLYSTGAFETRSRQEAVAERGAGVMPFDLEKTTHVFEATGSGGVEKVTADDPADNEQISLIREHLREEVSKFGRGDFSDPAAIHGEDMPGLKELEAGAERIDFRYAELPNGAQIEYATDDPALVSALHRWFEAQLTDHGEHASPSDGQHPSHH
jgi:hypothetical protein